SATCRRSSSVSIRARRCAPAEIAAWSIRAQGDPVISPRVDEHREAALRAGLNYVSDGVSGIRRERAGKGWVYYAPDGARITDKTERKRHVEIKGAKLLFSFRGKSGVDHTVSITYRRLARIVQQCQDLPGQELFKYIDSSGKRQTISSDDVNAYLREITGRDITAKDF